MKTGTHNHSIYPAQTSPRPTVTAPVDLSSEMLSLCSWHTWTPRAHTLIALWTFLSEFLAQWKATFLRLFAVPPSGCCELHEGVDCAFSAHFCFPELGTELDLDNQYYFVCWLIAVLKALERTPLKKLGDLFNLFNLSHTFQALFNKYLLYPLIQALN